MGAYWYPWYSRDRHWQEGYVAMPLLGEYDMTDPVVIDQHIDWATGHGIDFFAASWWGQNSFEDKVLRTHLPAASLAREIQFAILCHPVRFHDKVLQMVIEVYITRFRTADLSLFRYVIVSFGDVEIAGVNEGEIPPLSSGQAYRVRLALAVEKGLLIFLTGILAAYLAEVITVVHAEIFPLQLPKIWTSLSAGLGN